MLLMLLFAACRGGILADDMGQCKTLIFYLIKSNIWVDLMVTCDVTTKYSTAGVTLVTCCCYACCASACCLQGRHPG
jgi:hypothetical protein